MQKVMMMLLVFGGLLRAQGTPDFVFVGATNIAPSTHSLSSVTGMAGYAKTITRAGDRSVMSYTTATYSASGFIVQEGILMKLFDVQKLAVYSGFDAGVQNGQQQVTLTTTETQNKAALSYGGLLAYPINRARTWHLVLAGRNLFAGVNQGPILTFGISFKIGQ